MSRHLHRDLDRLQRELLVLAGSVEEALNRAIRALKERDGDLARQVIAGDAQIDADENRVEDECLKTLALHQPVAEDLRRVTTVMKINLDLERMADLAEDIAERAIHLARLPSITLSPRLSQMADLTTSMVKDCIDSFVQSDAQTARRVCRFDDQVDRCNDEIIRGLIRQMQQSPDMVEPGLSVFSATRHLERIADHATNIAEDVIYLVEGTIVRHHPEALEAKE